MVWTSPRTWATDETVPASTLNTHLRDNLNSGFPLGGDETVVWTPVLQCIDGAGFTPDTPTNTGRRWQVGPYIHCQVRWEIDIPFPYSTGGAWFVNLPVATSVIDANSSTGTAIGSWRGWNNTTSGNSVSGTLFLASTQTARFALPEGTMVTGSVPWIWNDNDVLTMTACYPIA